ncbi:hypothetical protein G0Q03_02945 [Epibacterium mobile]|nr:hypothetical protein [Tritonibacter mobilis]
MSATNSGSGNTSSGEPVSGSLELNSMGTAGTFKLQNLSGRTCTGIVEFDSGDVHSFPIQCNNGEIGTAMSTINRFSSQQTISYKLNSGEAGAVVLGQV